MHNRATSKKRYQYAALCGLAMGTAIGTSIAIIQRMAMLHRMPNLKAWQKALIAKHGEVQGAILAARIQAREEDVDNFIHHDPDFPNFQTREDYKQWVAEIRNAFPDLHLTIEDVIAEGDQVVVRWTFRGTNTGDMVTPMHITATGKQVTVAGITISHFADGKFVEDWHQGDIMSFMQQLGVVPAPV